MLPVFMKKVTDQVMVSDVTLAMLGLFLFSAAMHRLTSKGPMLWPFLGIIPSLLLHLNDAYEWSTQVIVRAGGTFPYRGMRFGGCHGVLTSDPAVIEYILNTRFANFPKGRYYRERFADLLGDGIFNADDQAWKEQRRAAVAEMHTARFAGYSADSVKHLVHGKLLPLLSRLSRAGGSVDLQDVFLRFSFDNICIAALGIDPGCLDADLPLIPFAKAFERATELTTFRFVVPPFVWKLMRRFDVGSERSLRQAIRTVHKFAEKTVADRRAEHQTLKISSDQRSDLLSRLMEDGRFSNKFLKEFCVSFILAGRDTSSVALAWFFWLLDKHPDVEARILDEIGNIVIGRRQGHNSYGGRDLDDVVAFDVDELKKMVYLQAALSESLRLYPSVPFDFKEALEDDVFPDGTVVRKGARVFYSIYAVGRMESIWGKDCMEFRPERWIREGDGGFAAESPFKYPVFNAGPRLCIGKRFAYMQMKMVVASVLLRYHVEVKGGQEVAPKIATTLYMKNGLRVAFKRRQRLAGAVNAVFDRQLLG